MRTSVLDGSGGARYRLLRRLGEGGAADIFLAQTLGAAPHHQRHVVAKRLRAAGEAAPASLVDEARLITRLDHPNIARALDVTDGASGFGIILECLHGEDLHAILDEVARTSQRVPFGIAVVIAAEVAAGLHHAHEARGAGGALLGVVHRDVSPANVLVTYDGEVKLLDFGIAKWSGATDRTQLGFVKGKAPYLSPEQCLLAPVDRRADVWALGAVLYELTTLRTPFGATAGDDEAIMERIVVGRSAPLPDDYPDELAEILRRCLQPSRERRYATAAELRDDLLALAARRGWASRAEDRARWLRALFGARNPPWLDDPPTQILAVGTPPRGTDAGLVGDPTVMAPPSIDLLAAAGAVIDDSPTVIEPRRSSPPWWLALVVAALVIGLAWALA